MLPPPVILARHEYLLVAVLLVVAVRLPKLPMDPLAKISNCLAMKRLKRTYIGGWYCGPSRRERSMSGSRFASRYASS